jgi:uncharacterized membrane protein
VTETLRVLALVEVVGLLAVPLAGAVLSRLPAGAHAFAKPLGLLAVAFVAWVAWALGVPNVAALAIASVVALGVAGAVVWRRVGRGSDPLWRWSEGIFALTFLGGALLVSYGADVWGTQKPATMALLSANLASEDFPPADPWQGGSDVERPAFGHFLMSLVIRLTGVEPTAGYTLAIALVAALTVTAAFGLCAAAVPRRPLRAGLAGAAFTALLGNLAAARDLLAHDGPLERFDWLGTARVIPGSVDDVPVFSWVLGDLHGAVIAVPFLLLALACCLPGRPGWGGVGVAAVASGALYGMSPWACAAALVVGVLALPWRQAIALVAGAALAALPALLTVAPEVAGAPELRGFQTFVGDLALTFGLPLVVLGGLFAARLLASAHPWRNLAWGAAVALFAGSALASAGALGVTALGVAALAALAIARRSEQRFIWLLAATGFACLAAAELVELRVAPGEPGARYVAWVLLAVAAAVALLTVRLPRRAAIAWRAVVGVLAVLSLAFPLAGTYARTGGFADGPSLDGAGWLRSVAPGDVAAIEWLRDNAPRDAVILEATGEEGSAFGHGRIAAYTGRPGARGTGVVPAFTGDADAARAFLSRTRVRYVVVGPLERTEYGDAGLAKWDDLGRRVLDHDGTTVWELRAPS